MNEVMKKTNADSEYQRLGKDETGSFTMILGDEPDKGIPQSIIIGYREEMGKILEVWQGERRYGARNHSSTLDPWTYRNLVRLDEKTSSTLRNKTRRKRPKPMRDSKRSSRSGESLCADAFS